MSAPLPPDEAFRLEVLNRYAVLDTPPEEPFDRLSRLAARIFRTPIALISLVDDRRQWFKACYGVDVNETDRKLAFCAYTILSDEVMVVEDAATDPRFCDNALVKGPPGIRFYAGAPLRTKEGVSIGSICVIDSVARKFSPAERASLEDLASMVVDELDLREKTSLMAAEIARRTEAEIELREAKAELDRKNDDLGESQQRLNALLDNAPAVIYAKDLEGHYLITNRPHAEVLGKTRDEITGRVDSELFPPEMAEEFRQHDREVIASGRTIEFEEAAHVRGELHVFQSVKFPLRDEKGEIYATCGISTDVTERKKAEEALREADARKAAILEASLDAIITIDHEGHILEVNPAAERIFGYPAEKMLGHDMAELIIPPRLREAHRAGMRRLLADGQGQVLGRLLELPGLRADGSELPLEIAVTRIPLDGKPMFTGHVRDISERKRAEEALQESQSRFERITANMPGMVFQFVRQTDGALRFTYVSPGCQEIFHIDPASIVDGTMHWSSRVHADDKDELDRSIQLSAMNLEPWSWEGRAVLPSGELRWVRGLSRPRQMSDGDIVWDGFLFDVTERKRAEDELRESRDEAQRANRAKSEFLSRMSHELRTPLNAILGFGQLLERAPLSPRQAESVTQITKAGRHLLDLINEVLDLSRIEAGRMPLSLEAVNASDLVREATCLIRPLCEERGIRMLEVMYRNYWVLADRQRLRQVLLNLLSNAVKYNKLGGAVEVRLEETALKRLNISITDTGFGIEAEKLEKIFTPFERLGAEHTGIEGSGIGLALSKRLLELMGGTLEVQSIVSRGSTFTIKLPSTSEPGEPTAALIELPPIEKRGTLPLVRRPVLYVEDNPANLRLMERILEQREDILLYTCDRGDEAIAAVRAYKPQLILLDLHLPGLDGEQILRSLRREPEFQALPVIIISADAMSAQVKRLLAAGASEYITKPIHIGEILKVLSKYLDQPIPTF